MEIKTNKLYLNFDKTITYVLDHIDGGHTLSKVIIEDIDFNQGDFFTFLPEHAKKNQLYHFCEGEINPTISTNEKHFVEGIGEFIHQERITTEKELSSFIEEYLNTSAKSFAIIDDVIKKSCDKNIEINSAQVSIYQDEVYYVLRPKRGSLDDIVHVIRNTGQVWHTLIVLCSNIEISHNLTINDFNKICSNINYVITGAHDGENFIYWVKRN